MGTIANACIIEKRNIAAIHKGHLKRMRTHRDRVLIMRVCVKREGNGYGKGTATHTARAPGT